MANTSSKDVAEALRFTPGVFIQPPTGQRGEPGIGIRGYSVTQVGLFIDGIPVNSIYDRQTDWGQFASFGVSEISVSKGYTSPIYGMNTIGGAVNIITSKPKDKLEINAKYDFITNNENRAAVSVGTNLGKYYAQLSYSFTGRNSYNLSNNFTPTPYQGSGEKRNSYYKNHTLRVKVGYEPNENHEYSLNFIYQKGEKGGMLNANGGGRFWQWPNYDKITAYILGNSRLSEKLSLNSRIYMDRFYNNLQMLGGNGANNTITANGFRGLSTYDDYAVGGIFTLGYDFDENKKLKVGLNLKSDMTNHTDKPLPGATGTNDNESFKDLSTSIFAEYTQRINQTFRFAVNGSYDRNDLLSVKTDEVKDTSAKHLQGFTLQAIGYAYVNEYVALYANIGQKSKLPTLKDRFSETWGSRVPNPNILPESAINYELGTQIEYDTGKITFALFYNDMRNMMITASMPNSACSAGRDCVRLENAKEGYAYGGEISIAQSFFDEKLRFNANYTYTQKKATNPDGTSYGVDGSRILDYPNHIANASLIVAPIKQFDLIALATFQSKQWYVLDNIYSQNNDIFLIDLKANYHVIKDLTLSLGAYNLLDRNYYYGSGYYQAGRRILAGIEYKF
ncbi:TonB-dependent receptor [Helicobacter sp. MIT 99-10781]|uniref:TonB-dependent receptor n=1 Tax=Helicobacter sp. MIT 99-10781 TaxID=1332285 RepID=UPI002163CA5F|nr:TonB-dependent receptor [Helicobacter sp. MIT 99-10781]